MGRTSLPPTFLAISAWLRPPHLSLSASSESMYDLAGGAPPEMTRKPRRKSSKGQEAHEVTEIAIASTEQNRPTKTYTAQAYTIDARPDGYVFYFGQVLPAGKLANAIGVQLNFFGVLKLDESFHAGTFLDTLRGLVPSRIGGLEIGEGMLERISSGKLHILSANIGRFYIGQFGAQVDWYLASPSQLRDATISHAKTIDASPVMTVFLSNELAFNLIQDIGTIVKSKMGRS